MRKIPVILIILVGNSLFAAPQSPILSVFDLGGVKTFYTEKLNDYISATLTVTANMKAEKSSILLECISNKSNKYYVGVRQEMIIHSPVKTVAAIMDDVDHYKELFPDYKDIHIIKKDGDKVLTYWEQEVPVPFVDNISYEMIYRWSWLNTQEKMYRYQLKAKTKLIASDGFIYLKELNEKDSLYIEYDFFDAEWGAAKALGARKIWYDSVAGLAYSDLATKLKAEHSDWSNAKAKTESKKILSSDSVVDCITPVL